MTASTIPDDIRRFIVRSVPSVPFLEALLLLRAQDGASWSAAVLAQRLYLDDDAGAALLHALQAAGVARPHPTQRGHWMYAPDSLALRVLLDRLAALYAVNLVGVTLLIHASNPPRN